MLTRRFQRLYDRLVGRWRVYHDAPRDPERVTELAQARADLDDTRIEIAEERASIDTSRRHEHRVSPRTAVDPEDLQRLWAQGRGMGES